MSEHETSADAEDAAPDDTHPTDENGEAANVEDVMEIVHPDDEAIEAVAGSVAQSLDADAQVAEANDRALRAHAELENYRRRAQRELQDALKYANSPMLRELLPVLDNLNRAIEATTPSDENTGLLEGVKMVAQGFLDALAKHGCQKIEALHAQFDPNIHEALSKIPNEEHPEMTVIHEMLPGFKLHDRVVRPSQVVVSAGSAEATTDDGDEE